MAEAKGRGRMRFVAVVALVVVAACAPDPGVPGNEVLYEVTPGMPLQGTSLSASGGDFGDPGDGAGDLPGTGGVAAAGEGGGPLPDDGTPLDDDFLNLTLYTIERQKVDARIAERELAEARDQLVVMEPQPLPDRPEDVNIAQYARQTSNDVGERVYQRAFLSDRLQTRRTCARFSNDDAAQRAFLANGGPSEDAYNLDPDGDGFACDWSPEPYRGLSF